MRHRKQNVKFGRSKSHREALVSMLVVGLIKAKNIRTTVQKAKVARQAAEKLVTVARKGGVNARRAAMATLQDEVAVKELFDKVVPMQEGRNGGYTRIVKLGQRSSDGAEMALLAWVDEPVAKKDAAPAEPAPAAEEPAK
jgi:large subunit ribosomal protein L17